MELRDVVERLALKPWIAASRAREQCPSVDVHRLVPYDVLEYLPGAREVVLVEREGRAKQRDLAVGIKVPAERSSDAARAASAVVGVESWLTIAVACEISCACRIPRMNQAPASTATMTMTTGANRMSALSVLRVERVSPT